MILTRRDKWPECRETESEVGMKFDKMGLIDDELDEKTKAGGGNEVVSEYGSLGMFRRDVNDCRSRFFVYAREPSRAFNAEVLAPSIEVQMKRGEGEEDAGDTVGALGGREHVDEALPHCGWANEQ